VRRAGFAALLVGRAPTFAELAGAVGAAEGEVAAAIAALVRAGRATLDAVGRVDGIAGLTRRLTRHSIIRSNRPSLQAWCGFDAVAISAALDWTATAATTCGACRAALTVEFDRGEPIGDAWAWLPPDNCEHVLRDFCSAADLFCDRSHLESWRTSVGHPPGEPHSVSALAALGRKAWADCLPPRAAPSSPGRPVGG
jgi:hypothetical protein